MQLLWNEIIRSDKYVILVDIGHRSFKSNNLRFYSYKLKSIQFSRDSCSPSLTTRIVKSMIYLTVSLNNYSTALPEY